ncbi:MAG: DUF1670 domain-containing protein [Desulfobacteraceae bacterium]|nr:DUF1670 domain-containing protein [Desulfobacteraceae bacterium]
MKIDRKSMIYERLSLKELNQQFQQRIKIGMGCNPFVAEAITKAVQDIYFPYLKSPENFSPGKMYFQCVSEKVGASTKISEADLVTVTLTLDGGKTDLDIRKKYGVLRLRQKRILRMCSEAFDQGGLLTVEDLAYRILNSGERTISRDLDQMRKRGENPPLRSTVKDIGKTITHRTIIIKNWLKGDELSDLKRKYNHSFSAIENYISTFKRVIFLTHEGNPVEQVAYLLKISVPLAKAHQDIWKECSKTAIPHRKKDILDLIGSIKLKKKRRES